MQKNPNGPKICISFMISFTVYFLELFCIFKMILFRKIINMQLGMCVVIMNIYIFFMGILKVTVR